MTRYLKWAPLRPPAGAVRARVAEILRAVERGGEIRACAGRQEPAPVVDLARVREIAEAQRAALRDLDALGLRHVPVASAGVIGADLTPIVLAKAAGVRHVTACVSPHDGRGTPPATLLAAGADRVLTLPDVPALAAMAFGLCGAEPVELLAGGGGAYALEAKRQLAGIVAVDSLDGDEVAVIADAAADPAAVSAALAGRPAVLITASRSLARTILRTLGGAVWRDHGSVALVADHEHAMRVADRHAPARVELFVGEPRVFLDGLRRYGALSIGGAPVQRLWVGTFLKAHTWAAAA